MVTIDQGQRDALHKAIVLDLSGATDVARCIEWGKHDEAQKLRERVEADWRLLDDLGWAIDESREAFTLTMPRDELASLLRRIEREAQGSLRDNAGPIGDDLAVARERFRLSPEEVEELADDFRDQIDEDLDLMSTCRYALAELGAS